MNEFDEKAKTWDDDSKRERAANVAEGIRRHVALTPSSRVFEYGCGTGLLSFALRPFVGHITLADNSSGMLDIVREKIAASNELHMHPLFLDIASGAPPAGPFDLICTQLVLHHVGPVATVIRAFAEILAPGGALCIADLEAEDGSFHGGGFTGHRGFKREGLERMIRDSGLLPEHYDICFTIARESPAGNRAFPVFLSISRKPSMA